MSPVVGRVARVGSYALWFVALFVVFSWLLFPWGRLADRLIVGAADAGFALKLDDLNINPFSIRAQGLEVGGLAEGDEATEWLVLDKLAFRLPDTGLVGGALAARGALTNSSDPLTRRLLTALEQLELQAELYDGDMAVQLGSDDDAARLQLQASSLDLSQYAFDMGSFAATPSSGHLRSKVDVTWHWEDPKKSSGTVDLVLDGLVLSGLKVQGFGLPETAFDRSELHMKISRGRAEMRDTAFEGDTLQAIVEGYIHLHAQPSRSRLALRLRFKVRDDLDGLLKVAFGAKPKHKDAEGWYHYQLNGTAAKPRLRESRAAARRARSRGSRTTKDKAGADDTKDKTPAPAAERDDDVLERDKISDERRDELGEERERLREERAQRREERKAKRDALIQKRNQRQDGLQADPAIEVVGGAEEDNDEEADPAPADGGASEEGDESEEEASPDEEGGSEGNEQEAKEPAEQEGEGGEDEADDE